MGITKWILGFDKSDVTVLQESQQTDVKQFQEVFSTLKEWQEAHADLTKTVGEHGNTIAEHGNTLAEHSDKIADLTKTVGEHGNTIAEHGNTLAEHSDKIADLTETVADQQKIMIACIVVSAVAAIAITSFVAFCIYQGVKLEKEKEKNSSKDTPDAKLSNVDTTDGTEKLQSNLKVANI